MRMIMLALFINNALALPAQTNFLDRQLLKPHSSINRIAFGRQYTTNRLLWDSAFSFLKYHDPATLPAGDHYPFGDSSVIVKVSYGAAKPLEQTKWEAHRKYIDLQLVGEGSEKIGVAPVSGAKEIVPYNETKDVANYQSEGEFYIAKPGSFFIFFPSDAHRPGIKVDDANVRKITVKIRYAN